jgi:hypothetical protein
VEKPLMALEALVPMFATISTINNQKITKVYARRFSKADQNKEQIFDQQSYDFNDVELAHLLSSLKRKATPPVVSSLQRSKRASVMQDGFKRPSTATRKTRSSPCSTRTTKTKVVGKSHQLFSLKADFPDLALFDKFTSLGLTYPEISDAEIQRVAKERCGVPSREMMEHLHRPEVHSSQEGKVFLQVVPNGGQAYGEIGQ